MRTEVVMEREIIGITVRQKHKSGFFNLPDLERVGNKHRLQEGLSIKKASDYFRMPSSKEFIESLKTEYGQIQIGGKGRGLEKWVHPFLFVDIALWFSPKLKTNVYKWIFDNLTIFRDNSGESFKKMTAALVKNYQLGGKVGVVIPEIAKQIYNIVGVSGKSKWEKATKEQLKKRDEIQTALEALSYTTKSIDNAMIVIEEMFR